METQQVRPVPTTLAELDVRPSHLPDVLPPMAEYVDDEVTGASQALERPIITDALLSEQRVAEAIAGRIDNRFAGQSEQWNTAHQTMRNNNQQLQADSAERVRKANEEMEAMRRAYEATRAKFQAAARQRGLELDEQLFAAQAFNPQINKLRESYASLARELAVNGQEAHSLDKTLRQQLEELSLETALHDQLVNQAMPLAWKRFQEHTVKSGSAFRTGRPVAIAPRPVVLEELPADEAFAEYDRQQYLARSGVSDVWKVMRTPGHDTQEFDPQDALQLLTLAQAARVKSVAACHARVDDTNERAEQVMARNTEIRRQMVAIEQEFLGLERQQALTVAKHQALSRQDIGMRPQDAEAIGAIDLLTAELATNTAYLQSAKPVPELTAAETTGEVERVEEESVPQLTTTQSVGELAVRDSGLPPARGIGRILGRRRA